MISLYEKLFEVIEDLQDYQSEYNNLAKQEFLEQLLKKGTTVENEDIDEEVKAKFLFQLVREYRRNQQKKKQLRLIEMMEKQVQ